MFIVHSLWHNRLCLSYRLTIIIAISKLYRRFTFSLPLYYLGIAQCQYCDMSSTIVGIVLQ